MPYPIAHPNVLQRAKAVLELQPIFLDTETTGTGQTDRIIQIGIVDTQGETLFQSLVNPGMPIPAESSAVNGITDDMVKEAPVWTQIWTDVEATLRGRVIGIYNADFDLRLLRQTNKAYGLPMSIETNQAFCVMKLFAAFYGEWNPRNNGFKSQKLEFAGRFFAIPIPNSHDAIDDARLTAALTKAIADYKPGQ
ncbi:MAG TPA: 3'-5' exonuclease [Anaerolineaceae bacterium]|nr:3'-5' exonuclease [Anaerolineaceae bacterium]